MKLLGPNNNVWDEPLLDPHNAYIICLCDAKQVQQREYLIC